MSIFRPVSMLLGLSLAALSARALAQEVTIIYRCIGATGTLTLRDSPCAKGETQEVRSMQRPKDPAPVASPAIKPAPPSVVAPPREVQVIYRSPPRPMYECVTAEGKRYISDNGEGNPRSVPLWTLGYPMWSHRNGAAGGGAQPPGDRPSRPGHPHSPGAVFPGGGYTWVRDECHALPQEEVCSRLSDRRYEIMRRYNSALQSEVHQLELEQRGIDARIANDCGNY
ncbi:MAG: DUF4124 domain-containing protein [Pseudoxanthomonas sp.]